MAAALPNVHYWQLTVCWPTQAILSFCQRSFWMVPIEMKHNGHYCQKCRDNQLITSSSHVFHESWICKFFSWNFMFHFERAPKCLFLSWETVIASFLNPIKNFYLVKVAFFQKVWFVFQISKSPEKYIPKNYPELEI